MGGLGGRWGGGNKEERKRGRQFANGTWRKMVCGPRMKKDERRGDGKKKRTSVYQERAGGSYRASAKVVLKNTIINCHLHLRCKAGERGSEVGRRGRKKRRCCVCPRRSFNSPQSSFNYLL